MEKNLDQTSSGEIEIHTMKEDLNGEANGGNASAKEDFLKPRVSEAKDKGSNPFLDEGNWGKKEPVMSENGHAKTFGKIVFTAIVFVIILMAAGGGYYFWLTRMDKAENLGENLPGESLLNEQAETGSEETSRPDLAPGQLSEESPNYLMLGEIDTNEAAIRQIMQNTAEKVRSGNFSKPVEFIVTDATNKPYTFDVFSQMAGLKLPDAVKNEMNSVFSLYFFNEGGTLKTGLAADFANEAEIKAALKSEEKNLVQALDPLYLAYDYSPTNVIFKDSSYKNINVRYYNLVAPEKLSLDYSVHLGRVYFATSEQTLRKIVDKELAVVDEETASDEEITDETSDIEEMDQAQ